MPVFADYVGIYHRCSYIRMPQEILDRANIVTGLQQKSRKGMAQIMAARMFINLRLPNGVIESTLQRALTHMMPLFESGYPIGRNGYRRKGVLPGELGAGFGIFSFQRVW